MSVRAEMQTQIRLIPPLRESLVSLSPGLWGLQVLASFQTTLGSANPRWALSPLHTGQRLKEDEWDTDTTLKCRVWLTTLWTIARLLCPWDSPGKNTGVGCHALFQGIFPTQGSNPDLPHCRQILNHLSHQGSPNKNNNLWLHVPWIPWVRHYSVLHLLLF